MSTATAKKISVVMSARDVPVGEQIRVQCTDGVPRQAEVLCHSHLRSLGEGGVLIKPLHRGGPYLVELGDEREVELVPDDERLPDPDDEEEWSDDGQD